MTSAIGLPVYSFHRLLDVDMEKVNVLTPMSRVRVIGSAVVMVAFSGLMVTSLFGFGDYNGRFSSWPGIILLVVIFTLCLGVLTPVTIFDVLTISKLGGPIYETETRLGFYRGDPLFPWRRGFVEVAKSDIRSIRIKGPSMRWGVIIRVETSSGYLDVETFYSSGAERDVLDSILQSVPASNHFVN